MKKIKSMGSFILALVLSLTGFAACSDKNGESSLEGDDPYKGEITEYTPTERYNGGIHRVSVTDSQTEFIKSGACDYKLLVAADASNKEETAAYEFSRLFQVATGIELPVEKSSSVTYNAAAKYIYFGDGAYAEAAGVRKPAEIKSNGYVIKTAGKSIIVTGGKDLGTLFGAYGLLEVLFGYEYYFQDAEGNDCYYIEKNVTQKNLPIIDVFENPDFDHAIAGYMPMHVNASEAHKMRMETINEVYITGSGISYVHNTLQYLPTSRYKESHPDWYSLDGTQLCYTARGDAKEFEALTSELSKVMIQAIEEQPDSEIITLTQMDEPIWCECTACRAMKTEYNTDAASCIKLINAVADKIEAWRAENAPERKITVVMFAYTATENPPVVKDENGNWKAKDDSVKLRDNVCLLFAPIYSVSFNHNMQDEVNKKAEDQMRGWEACADHVSVWSYSAMFYNYFMPYDTYAASQNQYKRWLDAGALWIFDNAQWDTTAPLGFSCLKAYLNSVWSWNVNKNYNELVDGFFENYFGSASGSMRKFYDELRIWLKSRDESGMNGLTGGSHAEWDNAENWSKPLLDRWLGYCEAAKEEIADMLSSDPQRYAAICNRIDIEGMMPRYMLLEFYSSYFSAEGLAAARRAFAADCKRLGVNKFAEQKDIELLIRDW